ncbi:MAG: NAD-dependent epimerase/dehydratase family protein [Polyangiales bacterium]
MTTSSEKTSSSSGKTLVTGGAGFIGSRVVRRLLDEERDVRVLILPGEDTRNLAGLDVEIVEGDVTDAESLKKGVAGCSRVFHLAAIYSDWLPRPEKMYEVNCIGSLNILWESLRNDVEKVVYTSSVVALGPAREGLATEETMFTAWPTNMEYARSKWLSEQEARTFCNNGLDVSFCCPGMPYGAGDIGPTPTGKFLLTAAKTMPKILPDNYMSVVDVDDVARGHLLAEKKGRNGESYILTGENILISEFLQTIASLVGKEVNPLRISPKLMHVLAPIGDYLEQRAYKIKKRPPVTGGAMRYAALNFRYDNRKAREELGMVFTPMRVALAKSFDWFIREGYIKDQGFISAFEKHGAKELANTRVDLASNQPSVHARV